MKVIKNLFGVIALFAVIGFFALPLTGCGGGDDGGGGTDYDMTGIYTFTNSKETCTWVFTSDGTYKCSAPTTILNKKTGTWKSKGNDVTISYYNSSGAVTVQGEEVFTVQANGNQVTLTLKDSSAQTSNVLVNFILVAKSVTLTKKNIDFNETFTSIEDFEELLSVLPANTAATPYVVKLNVSDLGGIYTTSGSVGNVLYTNRYKYVSLDLSGSTFTSIGNWAFSNCTGLTSVIFATGSNITDNNFGGGAFPEGSYGYGGYTLGIAYATGKAGTYTRAPNGDTWTKQN